MNALAFSFITILSIISLNIAHEVVVYEYGSHVPGDQVAFLFSSTIPAYTPYQTLNLTHNNSHFVKNYTYVRVEYQNAASKVNIHYNPRTLELTFFVKLPFVETFFQIEGYSLSVELAKKMEEEKKLKNQTVPSKLSYTDAEKVFRSNF
ncbi:uncharacterized protein LOC126375065 [Pectinophora gossypiella]|uniref:uncharacterized protein LOC126375065 n=1 Tax=Pectinophora gossypiella TaxID=13191 RepID=UPI00214E0B1E|nr:uncharacterized protein LOC126375065 [Pectinophora gossypiella]